MQLCPQGGMAMALKITLSQKQKLALTTHMKQSLSILQMDALSLKEIIDEALLSNPVLEEIDVKNASEIGDTFQICYNGEGTYLPNKNVDAENDENDVDMFSYITKTTISLTDYLMDQLNMLTIPKDLLLLSKYLILSIDKNGWLNESPKNIAQKCNVSKDKVHEALSLVQSLEPAGICASGYKECLMLQAKRFKFPDEIYRILESDEYLQYLANNQLGKLGAALNMSNSQVAEAAKMIRTLNPKPGLSFGEETIHYIVPDAYVTVNDMNFSITIGNPLIPDIQINGSYSQMLNDFSDPDVAEYLKGCLNQAQELIQDIRQRNKTLFLCITEITKMQSDYFRKSNGNLIPMTLKDIAEPLGMSISTISRTISNKYISCCHGVIALKSLFVSKVSSKNEEEHASSQLIQKLIQQYINNEDKQRPLSDPDLVNLLSFDGYHIARRTVTKYRTQLKILSVSQRRVHL